MKLPSSFLFTVLVATVPVFHAGGDDSEFEAMLDELLDGTVTQVTPARLADEMSDGNDEVVLLDARSRDEFETSHLAGARRVDVRGFDVEQLEGIGRDTPIVVYCSVGKRSEQVGEKLEKAGFTRVRNLRGGLFQWANEKRPLVDRAGPTRYVHPYNGKWGRWLAPHVPRKTP